MSVKLKVGKFRRRTDRDLWEIRYSKNGKRYSVYGKTQQEAYDKQKEHMKNLKNPVTVSNQTLQEWLENWLNLYKVNQVQPKTLQDMKVRIKKLGKDLLKKPLSRVTSLELQQFINSIERGRTREMVAGLLNDAFDKARKHRLIKYNPLELVKVKKYESNPRDALTQDQTRILLANARQIDIELEEFFAVMLLTGMRRSEGVSVTLTDIDLENKVLQIRGTKTKLSFRSIPIGQQLENVLISLMSRRKPGEKLFTISADAATKNFKMIAQKNNWTNLSLHSLRHTFATRCLEANIPLKLVQSWLGHSTYKMTADTYSHIQPKYNKKQVEELDKIKLI